MERSLWCWSNFSCSNRTCQHTSLCKVCYLEEQKKQHHQRGHFCTESSRQPGLQGPKRIWLGGSELHLGEGICREEADPCRGVRAWFTTIFMRDKPILASSVCPLGMTMVAETQAFPDLVVPCPLPAARESWKQQVGCPWGTGLLHVHRLDGLSICNGLWTSHPH